MITKKLDTPFVSEQMDNAGNQRQYANQFNQPTEADVHQAATREYTSPHGGIEQGGAEGIWDGADIEAAKRAKQRRDRIAEMVLQGLLSAGGYGVGDAVRLSVEYADRLIAELDRK